MRWNRSRLALSILGLAAVTSTLALAGPLWSTPRSFPVIVRIDFGPLGKPAREERLLVDAGSTAKDVVSLVAPIQSGAVCCNTREVAAIDGVWADPARNRWWTCRINGSAKIGPFRTALHPGDRVEWLYRGQLQ